MEFERIGKNTVQCHMSVEEMNEYGLRIEDFFTNQKKSREFLEHLVEKAEEEIGYEVESGMVSMQLMRLPDDSLVITFSDKGEEGIQGMINQLQGLSDMIDSGAGALMGAFGGSELGASLEDSEQEDALASQSDLQRPDKKTAKDLLKQHKELEKKKRIASRVYEFSSLEEIERFAASVEIKKNIPSRLYKDDLSGKWYLYIKKGKLRIDEYEAVCDRLMEYGVLFSKQPYAEQYLREHYHCIISKHALKAIEEYVS